MREASSIEELKIKKSSLNKNDFQKLQKSKPASAIAHKLSANPGDSKNQDHNGEDLFANCLVIGITYALGTDPKPVIEQLENQFKNYGYDLTSWLNISDFLAENQDSDDPKPWWETLGLEADVIRKKDEKTTFEMSAGTELREKFGTSILSELALWELCNKGNKDTKELQKNLRSRRLIVLSSFKQPDEIRLLKTVLGDHFFFIALYEDRKAREIALQEKKKYTEDKIRDFMDTDQDQKEIKHGQKLADTFALADYIMAANNDPECLKDQVQRCLKLLFGYPFTTPTLDEHGQYLAYCASLKSSDLSRQVGAVIVNDQNLLAMGANEPPQFGGGTYWPIKLHGLISEHPSGRDFMRCEDSNIEYQNEIAEDIHKALMNEDCNCDDNEQDCKERIRNALQPWITEYGRSVHAEMDAICSAARMGIPLVGATLYTTTFPCHNCARHIIAAGIKRVVFVEPYPKSQALTLHNDALYLQGDDSQEASKVCLEHFTGVCPQAFTQYFAVNNHDLGRNLERKVALKHLKTLGTERLHREALGKTLEHLPQTDQNSKSKPETATIPDAENLLDPPGKNSNCASKHFYQLWQEQDPKPALRFREFNAVLCARLTLFIKQVDNKTSN